MAGSKPFDVTVPKLTGIWYRRIRALRTKVIATILQLNHRAMNQR